MSRIKYRLPLSQFKSSHPVYAIRGHGLSLDFEAHPSLVFTFNTKDEREEAIQHLDDAAKFYAFKTSFTPKRSPSPIQMSEQKPTFTAVETEGDSSLDSMTVSASPPLTRCSSISSVPTPPSPAHQPLHDDKDLHLHHANTVPYTRPPHIRHDRSHSSNRSTSIAPISRAVNYFQKKSSSTSIPPEYFSLLPHFINLPAGVRFKVASRHFVCLTIGSRGDIQPYIALGKGLMADGHRVTIVTHKEYKAWIESFGITHRTAGGDPGALMKLSVENKVSDISVLRDHLDSRIIIKMFSPAFFRESLGNVSCFFQSPEQWY